MYRKRVAKDLPVSHRSSAGTLECVTQPRAAIEDRVRIYLGVVELCAVGTYYEVRGALDVDTTMGDVGETLYLADLSSARED